MPVNWGRMRLANRAVSTTRSRPASAKNAASRILLEAHRRLGGLRVLCWPDGCSTTRRWISRAKWSCADCSTTRRSWLMRTACVVVVPSTFLDPCPTVVLEAMAVGRPVVAAASGGIVDLVEEEFTGLLVAPRGDPRRPFQCSLGRTQRRRDGGNDGAGGAQASAIVHCVGSGGTDGGALQRPGRGAPATSPDVCPCSVHLAQIGRQGHWVSPGRPPTESLALVGCQYGADKGGVGQGPTEFLRQQPTSTADDHGLPSVTERSSRQPAASTAALSLAVRSASTKSATGGAPDHREFFGSSLGRRPKGCRDALV